jgi:hypothetical protein
MRAADAIRRMLPYTTAALVVALLYTGWTMYSRWSGGRAAGRQEEAERMRSNAEIVKRYASGEVRVLHFYASPGTIPHGEKGLLCYGVVSAKSVRLEPEVERLTPTLSRCIEIAPSKDTEYKLTADDGAGKSATESVLVRVR